MLDGSYTYVPNPNKSNQFLCSEIVPENGSRTIEESIEPAELTFYGATHPSLVKGNPEESYNSYKD